MNVVNTRSKQGKMNETWTYTYTREASKAKVNKTLVYAKIMSQIGKLAYEIELRIQIDIEDFMHDINQYEFKMDS